MKKLVNVAAVMSVVALVSGCAGYDQFAENTNRKMNTGWTEMLYGKQTVDTSALPPGMVVDLRYGKGDGTGIPGPAASKFYDKLLGSVVYPANCKNMLMFNVTMYNEAGGIVRTEPVMFPAYTAGTKQPISKDVIADPQMQKSSQVTKLVPGGVRCM